MQIIIKIQGTADTIKWHVNVPRHTGRVSRSYNTKGFMSWLKAIAWHLLGESERDHERPQEGGIMCPRLNRVNRQNSY